MRVLRTKIENQDGVKHLVDLGGGIDHCGQMCVWKGVGRVEGVVWCEERRKRKKKNQSQEPRESKKPNLRVRENRCPFIQFGSAVRDCVFLFFFFFVLFFGCLDPKIQKGSQKEESHSFRVTETNRKKKERG